MINYYNSIFYSWNGIVESWNRLELLLSGLNDSCKLIAFLYLSTFAQVTLFINTYSLQWRALTWKYVYTYFYTYIFVMFCLIVTARIHFGHSREDWITIAVSQPTQSLYPTPDFRVIPALLARQLSLPYAKYWNCAYSEFFPSSLSAVADRPPYAAVNHQWPSCSDRHGSRLEQSPAARDVCSITACVLQLPQDASLQALWLHSALVMSETWQYHCRTRYKFLLPVSYTHLTLPTIYSV